MCDTLCVRSGDTMLFAKNSDRHPDEAQVVEWHPARTARAEVRTQYLTITDHDAYAFVGSRPTWLWGAEHGVNEHGLAVGNEKIWTVERPSADPPALLGMDLVRLALERARTADEALDVVTALVERCGQGGTGEPNRNEPYFSSFLVADPGGGYVIETSDRTWAARPVGNGAAISNRVTLTTDWTRASPDVPPGTDFDGLRWPRIPTGIADHRLAVTRATVARGEAATVRELAETMRNHGPARPPTALPGSPGPDWEGFTVCMHRRESRAQTTASMLAELRAGSAPRVWTCLGNPCTSVYVPGFPPDLAPQLADAQQWQRFARLRDRVEGGFDALSDVRGVLGGVEADLWAAADDVFASGRRSQVADFTRGAWAPVDAALHRLGV